MKYLLWLALLLAGPALALVPQCGSSGVTVGTLTLTVSQPRASCRSPCLLFFDATASTDTATLPGANTPIQDVYYAWSFGDPNASGTGTWAFGSRANKNSMNAASGPVAAHLYILPTNGTTDLNPLVEVWAYDGTNIATCTIPVTVFAPSGANGYSGTSTICVTASATIGTGCPTGAVMVTNQGNLGTALTNNLGSNTRVLFKCGDTFTGTFSTTAQTGASIGAYGGCENTTTSRPIFQNSTGHTITVNSNDLRISDIDFEDGTHVAGAVIGNTVSQLTLYNLNCNGYSNCYATFESTQSGVIRSVMTGMQGSQGVFWNFGENQCLGNPSLDTLFCGNASYNPAFYVPIAYNALIGNSFSGTGNTSTGAEVARISACRFCVVENNSFANQVAGVAALLKIHSGNTNGSAATWIGQFTEYMVISDNYFTGTSGAFHMELSPQNSSTDERLRFNIVERNLWNLSNGQTVGLELSSSNTAIRQNVWFVPSTGTASPAGGLSYQARGIEPNPNHTEFYNNSCYGLIAFSNACVFLQANSATSFAENNLFFCTSGSGVSTVTNNGTGNTISNNSANGGTTFAPVNSSGAFTSLMDFKPTAAFTGADSTVPNYFDASLLSWIGSYTLGAVSQAAPAQ